MSQNDKATDPRVDRSHSSFFVSSSPTPNPRPLNAARGFTLVELLIVITIIGMLAALASMAAVKAINAGRNAQVGTEIGMLDAAVQSYKNDIAGGAPPDFSELSAPGAATPGSQDVTNRQNRIMAHLRKAYPRINFSYGYAPATQQGTLQYAVQQAFVNYDNQTPTPPILYGSNPPGSTFTWGDMNNLDPAEALVFWLGGLPAPPFADAATGKWLYTLRGFSANKLRPFDLTDASRDNGPFTFQQGQLGDADGDGWPEYYPPIGTPAQPPGTTGAVANPIPPYVYFDATSYTSINPVPGSPPVIYPASAQYPSPLVGAANGPGAQPFVQYGGVWGAAIPYGRAENVSGTGMNTITNITWLNDNKFQIVCAGNDGQYWFDGSGAAAAAGPNNRLRFSPSGVNLSQGDLDNLTNFTTGTLQSAMP